MAIRGGAGIRYSHLVELLHQAVVEHLRVHPRLTQQHLGEDRKLRLHLATSLPAIVPFRGRSLEHIVALLDWDHRLPSHNMVLQLHAFYDADAVGDFEAAMASRLAEIERRNLYPEFDVPDFEELPADESYAAVMAVERPAVESLRLVSSWRRTLDAELSERAVAAVKESSDFAEVRENTPRPGFLGDLEAVAWTPPCESSHDAWTIDVWWLISFDGRMGRGWSFLVDLDAAEGKRVLSRREFAVRTG